MATTTPNTNNLQPNNSYENNEETWEKDIAKANRSSLIVIRNLTSESLFRTKFSLIHGMWYVIRDHFKLNIYDHIFNTENIIIIFFNFHHSVAVVARHYRLK